jgi:hypothetical protein
MYFLKNENALQVFFYSKIKTFLYNGEYHFQRMIGRFYDETETIYKKI